MQKDIRRSVGFLARSCPAERLLLLCATINAFRRKVSQFIGLSVCGSRTSPKTTVRERCDGARARPNPSYPLPLGHCWDDQTHLAPVSLKLVRGTSVRTRLRKEKEEKKGAILTAHNPHFREHLLPQLCHPLCGSATADRVDDKHCPFEPAPPAADLQEKLPQKAVVGQVRGRCPYPEKLRGSGRASE